VTAAPVVTPVDPFDLPEWLGDGDVTWTATGSVHGGHLVPGELSGTGDPLGCDLLGADQAFPRPVLDDGWRQRAHQAWTHGQVLLVDYDGRLTLAVPGTAFTADRALEAIGRLAKAVGVKPGRFVAALRL
jgi:hypothetical protein